MGAIGGVGCGGLGGIFENCEILFFILVFLLLFWNGFGFGSGYGVAKE